MDARKINLPDYYLAEIEKNLLEWRGLSLIFKDKLIMSLPELHFELKNESLMGLEKIADSLDNLIHTAAKTLSTYISHKDVNLGVFELGTGLNDLMKNKQFDEDLLTELTQLFEHTMDNVELVSQLNWLPDIDIRDDIGKLVLSVTNKSGVVHQLASLSLDKARYVHLNGEVKVSGAQLQDSLKNYSSDGWLFSHLRPEDITFDTGIAPEFAEGISQILSDALVVSSTRVKGEVPLPSKTSISEQVSRKWAATFGAQAITRPGALPSLSRLQTAKYLSERFYITTPLLYEKISSQFLAPDNKQSIRAALVNGWDILLNGGDNVQCLAAIQRELKENGVSLNSVQLLSIQSAITNYSSAEITEGDMETIVLKVIKAGDVGMKLDLTMPEQEVREELNDFSYSVPKLMPR